MAARRVRRPPSSEGPIARARHGSRPASKRPGDGIRFAPAEADRVLRQALREDRSGADRTTRALLPRGVRAVAFVLAERSGVVSGIRASARLGRLTGLSVRSSLADG
ncbi:MAG TPA: hypothetical protein VGS23_00510, partial [Thermoplasmata archaeon]|nr:hypothetical protein [Thermoplasmata archaeon]